MDSGTEHENKKAAAATVAIGIKKIFIVPRVYIKTMKISTLLIFSEFIF